MVVLGRRTLSSCIRSALVTGIVRNLGTGGARGLRPILDELATSVARRASLSSYVTQSALAVLKREAKQRTKLELRSRDLSFVTLGFEALCPGFSIGARLDSRLLCFRFRITLFV